MTHVPPAAPSDIPPRRATRLGRARNLPAPARHACSAGMVGGMAALPLAGLPVLPEGQPFLLVLAILGAALLFGRGSAVSAAVMASLLGAVLLMPSAGAAGADAVRGGLSLVAFLVVAFGIASAIEAMRRIFAVMDVADARRASGVLVPVRTGRPGAARLLMMSPEERRRRFSPSP